MNKEDAEQYHALSQLRLENTLLRKENAELEAALREILRIVDADGADESYDKAIAREAACAIARAESATPAKHPDAEPEVIGGYEGEGGRRFWWTGGTWLYPGQEVAVISARKQEAAR